MSGWIDYGLYDEIESPMLFSYKHLEALRLALNERYHYFTGIDSVIPEFYSNMNFEPYWFMRTFHRYINDIYVMFCDDSGESYCEESLLFDIGDELRVLPIRALSFDWLHQQYKILNALYKTNNVQSIIVGHLLNNYKTMTETYDVNIGNYSEIVESCQNFDSEWGLLSDSFEYDNHALNNSRYQLMNYVGLFYYESDGTFGITKTESSVFYNNDEQIKIQNSSPKTLTGVLSFEIDGINVANLDFTIDPLSYEYYDLPELDSISKYTTESNLSNNYPLPKSRLCPVYRPFIRMYLKKSYLLPDGENITEIPFEFMGVSINPD